MERGGWTILYQTPWLYTYPRISSPNYARGPSPQEIECGYEAGGEERGQSAMMAGN